MKYLPCLTILMGLVLATAVSTESAEARSNPSRELSGYISICKNKLCLRLPGQRKSYHIQTRDYQVKKSLRKLSAGDYLKGSGTLSDKTNSVYLREISYVGLSHLIGAWQSYNGYVYDFINYSSVDYYAWNGHALGKSRSRRNLQYRISPGSGNSWTMFLVDKEIEVGKLDFTANEVKIYFYDDKTGKVRRKIRLFPYE